ncbi:malectin domain-containing carbohydrate-binding protein [Deinococcus pimensis]|uniref:malectin domain-containing carbohydrate-binding protein n=1 Tax=Deinococcus pimensis TaxID=309888 RepID=UPI0004B0C5EB|nr:malectin domain-containing carbohydrate-binding protein [Deinococcus pimensis]
MTDRSLPPRRRGRVSSIPAALVTLATLLSACGGPTSPSASPTSSSVLRLNLGGPTQKVGSSTWLGCGTPGTCPVTLEGGAAWSAVLDVAGALVPASVSLYQSEWTAPSFALHVPVPDGSYVVRLHFADLTATSVGQRVFDVNVEGTAALKDLDVVREAGGTRRALERDVTTEVRDGRLDLEFVGRIGNALVNAVEILPAAEVPGSAGVSVGPSELVLSATKDTVSPQREVLLANESAAPLTVRSVRVEGADAAAFTLVDAPTTPLVLGPGERRSVRVSFSPGGRTGALSASVNVTTDGGAAPAGVNLYGLSASGYEGDLEPPLQQIASTLGYALNVGTSDLLLGTGAAPIGDEVRAWSFRRAGPGPVTVRPVARYSPEDELAFGYYTGGTQPVKTKLGAIARGGFQTLLPSVTAGSRDAFDPGDAVFGFYAGPTSYAPRDTFTDDRLNTGPLAHAVRVYPVRDRSGQVIANQYLLAMEPAANGDYNDYVFVIGNVTPAQ